MPTNIEVKALIESVDALLPRVVAIATSTRTDLTQDDTFFTVPDGRLKLRTLGEGHGELIFYRRPDERGPKPSFFTSSHTADPDGLCAVLARANGAIGRVRKQRILYTVGATRIHLDRVEGLGDFLELEVMLSEGQSVEDGTAEAYRVLGLLGVDQRSLVEGAYVDLLAAARLGA